MKEYTIKSIGEDLGLGVNHTGIQLENCPVTISIPLDDKELDKNLLERLNVGDSLLIKSASGDEPVNFLGATNFKIYAKVGASKYKILSNYFKQD